jgi:hypothetical protein
VFVQKDAANVLFELSKNVLDDAAIETASSRVGAAGFPVTFHHLTHEWAKILTNTRWPYWRQWVSIQPLFNEGQSCTTSENAGNTPPDISY